MEFIVFFKIVEVSLSIVFTYVQAKLNETKQKMFICHAFCISYNKNIDSQ